MSVALEMPFLQAATITRVGNYSLDDRYGAGNWNIQEGRLTVNSEGGFCFYRYGIALDIARAALSVLPETTEQSILQERWWLTKQITEMKTEIRGHHRCHKRVAIVACLVITIVVSGVLLRNCFKD